MAGLDLKNKEITRALISYLREPYTDVKFAALFALGRRGDPDAIAPLEELVKSGDLNLGDEPYVEMQIQALKQKAAENRAGAAGGGKNGGSGSGGGSAGSSDANQSSAGASAASSSANGAEMTLDALKQMQKQMDEINTRLGKIETQLSDTKK